ncbi:MAG: hypothetical protein ACN4G0_19010 [Polyangiales bacterium]
MGADWLNALEDVGGRLLPAARDFLLSQHPPLTQSGAPAVRWLAAQVDEFVDLESSEAQDDRFVEGAGALLGLLLIDHLGGRSQERDGCHRVQLGRFGWFDPFTAIQEVLDADDPRSCFSEYLRVAEQEADAKGPVSRVVRVFADELGRLRPDVEIASQFELTVDLSNGASVDLARLERVARDQDDDAATDAARRIISMLPGAENQAATPWNEAASRLLPRLVSDRFLASLPAEQDLHLDALGGGVHLALQLRYGERARYVRRSESSAWARDSIAVRQQAIDNLVERSRSLRIERVSDEILRLRQGDGLDGARLLLPDLHARLAQLEAGAWLAAAPHRDVLLVAPERARARLAERAEDAALRAPHPVSASLFTIAPRGPRPAKP